MQEIANHVYIETNYPGVVVGIIQSGQQLLLIDAPFRLEDQQLWRDTVNQFGKIKEKYLLLMDSHIDRAYGARAIEANVLAHKNAVEILLNRPNIIRRQDLEFGVDLEIKEMPNNFHWPNPDIVYSHDLLINLGGQPIKITHQPGAHLAGSWLHYEAEKLIFVGDSVVVNQPPFLAWSDLESWIEEMNGLATEGSKKYTIISSRSGVIKPKSIEKMHDLLVRIHGIIQGLVEKGPSAAAIDDAALAILRKMNYDREMKELYRSRLVWGIKNYIQRHDQTVRTEN
jgi:glyoxylase-like metal-dependent hydrolase (beta-lactamase superfamily II)